MSFIWTDQTIAAMRQMAESGVNSTQIARLIGASRNAVLGKAFRLGIKFTAGRVYVSKVARPGKSERRRFVWSPRAIERLREYSDQGIESAQIASKLSREFVGDITPSAVRAKAAALRLKTGGGRSAQIQRWREKGLADPKRIPNVKKAKRTPHEAWSQPIMIADVIPKCVTFADLTRRSCRFPLGDPQDKGFVYCGLDRHRNSPYCAGHHQLCYRRAGE